MFYIYYFNEAKTLEFFWELERIGSGVTDSDDESSIDADDATIWERGESTRRCANSFSYIGIRADGIDEAATTGVGATDEVFELTDSTGTTAGGLGATDEVFEPTDSTGTTTSGVDATGEVLEPTNPFGAAIGGDDTVIEFLDVANSVIGGFDTTDESFELMYALTDVVDGADGGFELTYP